MGLPGTILCILMLLLHKSSQQQAFNDEERLNLPKDYKIGWMETLKDETLLSNITIPGTHDAMALYGTALAKCQAWSLEDQLKAGIRYFDLRVSGLNLKIMHGVIYQHTSLPEVLKTIRTFLAEFRKETVLVRVKPVFPRQGTVPNSVEDLIQKDQDIWDASNIPNIGQVRGKIVFVQKNSFNLGIMLHETDKKGDYKVRNVESKKQKIVQHLNEAANQCSNGTDLSLNYSSGTSLGTLTFLGLLPKKLASEINPWLYKYLEKELKKNPKPCFGIIAMDFPGFDLIQNVIKFNT